MFETVEELSEKLSEALLEILSAWEFSIPEFGTVRARSIPFVVLTSNEERRLGDPIRRRSLYVRVDHPTPEREAEIIASRTPGASHAFHNRIAVIAGAFRNYSLEKPPSVSEMIDQRNAHRCFSARKYQNLRGVDATPERVRQQRRDKSEHSTVRSTQPQSRPARPKKAGFPFAIGVMTPSGYPESRQAERNFLVPEVSLGRGDFPVAKSHRAEGSF